MNKISNISITIILTILPFMFSMAQHGSFYQFRGTNCSGISSLDATPPIHLKPEDNLACKTAIAEGVSSLCIWGDQIFLTGFNATDRALVTYCINRENGAILWEQAVYPVALEQIHPVRSYAVLEDVLYIKRGIGIAALRLAANRWQICLKRPLLMKSTPKKIKVYPK